MLLRLLMSLKHMSTSIRFGVLYKGARCEMLLWARYREVRCGKGGKVGKWYRRL